MKASEYISALQRVIEQHGDLELVDPWDSPIEPPEVIDGDFVVEVESR